MTSSASPTSKKKIGRLHWVCKLLVVDYQQTSITSYTHPRTDAPEGSQPRTSEVALFRWMMYVQQVARKHKVVQIWRPCAGQKQ